MENSKSREYNINNGAKLANPKTMAKGRTFIVWPIYQRKT
jgi:hypothetical protein